jgi:hypothetical protein
MSCQYIYKNTSSKPKGTVCGRRLKSADSNYCWQHKASQSTMSHIPQKKPKNPEFI